MNTMKAPQCHKGCTYFYYAKPDSLGNIHYHLHCRNHGFISLIQHKEAEQDIQSGEIPLEEEFSAVGTFNNLFD